MEIKKTLVIMGTHPKSLELFDWSRKDCDIWMFNEAPNQKDRDGKPLFPNASAFFQMHHEAIWKNPTNRSDNNHYKWLTSGNTPTAYMQKKYQDIPKSVEYPIKEVLSLTKNITVDIDGNKQPFKFISSSPEFALALVAKMWKEGERYQKVEVWGIELEQESEYLYQRTGFGFWVGHLAALGIDLEIHSTLFKAPIYGYEGDIAIPSKQFEDRISELSKELGNHQNSYQQEAKEFLSSLSGLLRANISLEINQKIVEINKRNEPAGMLNGRLEENRRFLERARAMEEVAGISVFSIGEIEGNRIARSKQYAQVNAEAMNLNTEINLILNNLLGLKKGSKKRQEEIDLFGQKLAELMNKNMLMFLLIGAV